MKTFYDMYQILKESSGGGGDAICHEVKSFIDKEYEKSGEKNLYFFCRNIQEEISRDFDITKPVTNILEELQFYSLLIAYVCQYLQDNELNVEDCYKSRRGISNIVFLYGNTITTEEEASKVFDISMVIYRNTIRISNGANTLKLIDNMRKFATKHGFNRGSSWQGLVAKLISDRTDENESFQDDFVIAMGLSGFGTFAKQYSDFSKAGKVGIDRPRDYTKRMSQVFTNEEEEEEEEEEDENSTIFMSKKVFNEYDKILEKYIPKKFIKIEHAKLIGSFETFGPYNLNDRHPDYRSEDYTRDLTNHMKEYDKIIFGQNKFRDEVFMYDWAIAIFLVCKKKQLVDDFKDLLLRITAPPMEFVDETVEKQDLPIDEREKNILKIFFVKMKKFVEIVAKRLIRTKVVRTIAETEAKPLKGSLEAKIKQLALSISRSRKEFISNEEKLNELIQMCIDEGLFGYNIIVDFFRNVNDLSICDIIDEILSKEGIN
jgi:hypothetical protein